MFRRLRTILFRNAEDRALAKEIAFHIERETEKNVALGMSPAEAYRHARGAFGSVPAVEEAHRDGRRVQWIDELFADTRYALRQMRRAPMFSAVAIGVLAIGIGVNSAVFAFVDGLLKPPARGLDNPSELVRVNLIPRYGIESTVAQQLGEMVEFREQQQVFSVVGAFMRREVVAGAAGTSTAEYAAFVSGGYFATMRPRMAMGRPLAVADDRLAAADPSVVISHQYWRSQFGGDSAAIGSRLRVNGVALVVVGVLPERITGLGVDAYHAPPPLLIPMATQSLLFATDSAFLHARTQNTSLVVSGRLKPGHTLADAKAEVGRVAPPCYVRGSARRCLGPGFEQVMPWFAMEADEAKEVLQVGAVVGILTGLLLVVACANISILLLGRAVMRRREIAVRLSLGAGRNRLIRQLVTESAVLAVASSVVGLLILRWSGGIIRSQFSELDMDLAPSWRIVALSVAFAAGTGLIFGLLPAFHATRATVADALKDAAGGLGRTRSRLQRAFVVAEVAVSVTLVCTMGLFAQAAWRYVARPSGFTISDSVLLSSVPLSLTRHSAQSADHLMTTLRARIAQVPGVDVVSASNVPAPYTMMWAHGFMRVTDSPTGPTLVKSMVGLVDPSYFDVMGMPVRAGRAIDETDTGGAVASAVVSKNLADELWPGLNPVGRTIAFDVQDPRTRTGRNDHAIEGRSATIVGVVDSVGRGNSSSDRYMVYLSRRQVSALSDFALVVRASQAPSQVAKRVADVIRAVDPDLPFGTFKSTAAILADRQGDTLQAGKAAALAGIVALILSCVGLFAIVAFAVAQRAREIGIRIALGATQRQVVATFFRDGLRLAMVGFAIGIPLALAVMRVFQSQVLGIGTLDLLPIAAIVVVLLVVAAMASWLPARRASSVDPLDAIRSE